MATPRLLTIEETCQALGVARSLVFRFIREGDLASVRIGKRRMIPEPEVQRLLDARIERQDPRPSGSDVLTALGRAFEDSRSDPRALIERLDGTQRAGAGAA